MIKGGIVSAADKDKLSYTIDGCREIKAIELENGDYFIPFELYDEFKDKMDLDGVTVTSRVIQTSELKSRIRWQKK